MNSKSAVYVACSLFRRGAGPFLLTRYSPPGTGCKLAQWLMYVIIRYQVRLIYPGRRLNWLETLLGTVFFFAFTDAACIFVKTYSMLSPRAMNHTTYLVYQVSGIYKYECRVKMYLVWHLPVLCLVFWRDFIFCPAGVTAFINSCWRLFFVFVFLPPYSEFVRTLTSIITNHEHGTFVSVICSVPATRYVVVLLK